MSNRKETQDYYNNLALSQSELKLLLDDPKKFKEFKDRQAQGIQENSEDAKHFLLGSAVDCMLTSTDFLEEFHVSSLENKPSDNVRNIINSVFSTAIQKGNDREFTNFKSEILEACNNFEYYPNWKDETRVNKILENYNYWRDLVVSEGKKVLSAEEYLTVRNVVASIKNHKFTKNLFEMVACNGEILYQFPIFFNHKNIDCKALLDMVIINSVDKTIQPIDIKTTSGRTVHFPTSFRKYRYDIQAAWYTLALEYYKNSSIFYSDYKVLPFKFIVESTTDIGRPLVFTCSKETLYTGRYGVEESIQTRLIFPNETTANGNKALKYKGFETLLDELIKLRNTDFKYSSDILEVNGDVELYFLNGYGDYRG